MSKAKLFVENILVYGLGGVISKLVPLLMLPIVTRLMPGTEYFGLSDMSNTALQFASAVAIIGMYDAMYRMFFEKEDEQFKKEICSTTFAFTAISSLFVCALMILFKEPVAKLFFKDIKYSYLVYITAVTTLVSATNTIVAAPTRMQNKRTVFLITNTVSPILSYSISIPLILMGHYVIALPLAALIAGVSMEVVFWILNRNWFNIKLFKKEYLKPLLIIALPLFPNFLIYWIFNSSDKVMITNILNVGEAGIYSVGSKLGHASQLIYTAFAGGWQFFAFSTMKEKNQVESNSKIFEYLGIISYIATAFICAISFVFFKLAFAEQYLVGYVIAPYLFLAPLLQMLFQVAANQFIVVKKTWPNLFILMSGAIINVVLNFTLIPVIGIEGASIATLIGYIVSDIICVIVLCKMKLMVVSFRFIIATLSMALFFCVWRLLIPKNILLGLLAAVAMTLVMVVLYRDELNMIISRIKGRKKPI